ncbi:MAG: MBL fold metallo-hydrolase [Myxococcota bacterium]|nr:MBL fold metallo-hydrolase [Myxococcota bacterium]
MIRRLATRPAPTEGYWQGPFKGHHTLRWLGTAGFTLESGQKTLVFDPFISRPGLLRTALLPLPVDKATLRREIPRADDVLVGHSHYDHALDAPALCEQTGATLWGSVDTANIARGYGLPEHQIRIVPENEDIELSGGIARALPSQHGRVYFNRVSLAGDIPKPVRWPPRTTDLRHGAVYTWWVNWGGLKVVHVDSADYRTELLQGLEADVVCLCAIGRKYRPGYTQEILAALKPKLVVPCHWDWFFGPLSKPTRCLPGVDLPGFLGEIRSCGHEPCLLPVGGSVGFDEQH